MTATRRDATRTSTLCKVTSAAYLSMPPCPGPAHGPRRHSIAPVAWGVVGGGFSPSLFRGCDESRNIGIQDGQIIFRVMSATIGGVDDQ